MKQPYAVCSQFAICSDYFIFRRYFKFLLAPKRLAQGFDPAIEVDDVLDRHAGSVGLVVQGVGQRLGLRAQGAACIGESNPHLAFVLGIALPDQMAGQLQPLHQRRDGARLQVQAAPAGSVKDVVLVHGGFVDGSGWQGVYDILTKDGYRVTIVQNPTTSLADDVAATRRALDAQDGPTILVGHSYGGVVISEAGNHPKVKGLVYVAAFAADKGESVSSIIANPPPGAPVPPILPPQDGFLFLDRDKLAESFAADVTPSQAAFMADSQVPWGVAALDGKVTAPAWRSHPTWYLVTENDHMIPAPAQRQMAARAGATVVETPGSHAIYVSNPQVVENLIEQAAHNAAK